MTFEYQKSIVRDYFVRNRVSYGLLLGSGVFIFMRPGSQTIIFIGLFISFVGLLIRSWAAGCIKKSKSLCTEGPYAFVRHPLYLGSLLMSAGIAVVFTSVDSLWLSGIFWAIYSLYFWGFYTAAVASEERLLAERFSAEWPSYKENVPAFFPFSLTRFKNGDFKSYSFSQYIKNKEYNAVLGWTAIAVLIFKLSPMPSPHSEVVPEMVLVSEDINQIHKPFAGVKPVSPVKTAKIPIAANEKEVNLSNLKSEINPPPSAEKTARIDLPVGSAENDNALEERRASRKLSLVNPWFGNAILGTSALNLFNEGIGSATLGPSAQTASAFTLASVVSEKYDSIWVDALGYTFASAVGYSHLSQGQNLGSDVVGGAFVGIVIGKSIAYFDRKKSWSKRVSSDGRSVTYKQRF